MPQLATDWAGCHWSGVIGQDEAVAAKLPPLGANQAIASLPALGAEELLPVCELLCQEGFTTWSLPIDRIAELPELLAAFGRRVRIGVQGVTQVAEVSQASKAGAAFAGSVCYLPKLVKAVSGFPVILGGLTPTELRSGIEAGAAAVQVVPSDVYLPFHTQLLIDLIGDQLIAGGYLDPGQAAGWLEEGAIGLWPQQLFDPELASEPSLSRLREHVQRWRPED
jgi:2-dehydro-3-deoxyphosphogluconate aldolase / (4S)-4-hydroxy-2-oxoglutarate aldolase